MAICANHNKITQIKLLYQVPAVSYDIIILPLLHQLELSVLPFVLAPISSHRTFIGRVGTFIGRVGTFIGRVGNFIGSVHRMAYKHPPLFYSTVVLIPSSSNQ